MEKKIRKRLLLMGLCGMLLMLGLCVIVFYSAYARQTRESLAASADLIEASYEERDRQWVPGEYEDAAVRVIWIDPQGIVREDNRVPEAVGQQLSASEVEKARSEGEGFDFRTAETFGESIGYYARRLPDGHILCLAMDVESQVVLLRTVVPALIFCGLLMALLGFVLSVLLTKQLVRPIVCMGEEPEKLEEGAPYPELQPFVEAYVRNRELQQQNEAVRQEFTANVSHELKTPLTSISGYAELIETGIAKAEDVPKFADKIHKESQRLLNLVNDIIELTRLDATEDELLSKAQFEAVDLREVLSACADHLAVSAQRSYVTLLQSGEKTLVQGDRGMLEELCINLCDNAIRYNRPGGKVTLSCGVMEHRPYLRVLDDGIGIPEEEQERVYERFYRVDKSRSKATGGTGLGLAIVKHIAALHTARLEMKSCVDKGTDIRVVFPAQLKR